MFKILVLNGPNLNLLGRREPQIYGKTTLADVHQNLQKLADQSGHQLDFRQSNAEHELIGWIQALLDQPIDGLIFNPGGFTHTSIALRDAILAVSVPFIELHLSNVYARESFRQHSFFSDIALGVIAGFGVMGYEMAFQALLTKLSEKV
jgi:3-dehydroquinate dehydratase-2